MRDQGGKYQEVRYGSSFCNAPGRAFPRDVGPFIGPDRKVAARLPLNVLSALEAKHTPAEDPAWN